MSKKGNPARLKADFIKNLHSPQQLEQLFEYLPDVYFFAKNLDSQFMMANNLFIEKCGANSEEDIIGKTDHDYFPADRAESYTRDDRLVMEKGESIVNKVELAPEPNNSINWFVTSKVPLYSEENRICGLAGTARDLNKANSTLTPYKEMAVVIEYIRDNYHEQINVQDLAVIVHLSVSQFERKFRNTFQMRPIEHITKVRIDAACRSLINTSDKISRIALECGFYDHSHFTRQFTKIMGVSPMKYRKKF